MDPKFKSDGTWSNKYLVLVTIPAPKYLVIRAGDRIKCIYMYLNYTIERTTQWGIMHLIRQRLYRRLARTAYQNPSTTYMYMYTVDQDTCISLDGEI